jgi:dTDP-4-amino-4,6-dideoxygalactose transaminase
LRIPLAKPDIGPNEIGRVVQVLESDRLALGPQISEFEQTLAEYVGVNFAVAVNGGTSALHLLMCALGIGPGDEVITTPFSFVASANCILFVGATPIFVDVDPITLCLDPEQVEKAITARTKAILAVDIFGHPADWPALERIAARHDLHLVEDSAEALGSRLGLKQCGSFGEAAIFGFYPNKVITTGEGGAVVTNDAAIAAMCRSLANQGRQTEGDLTRHVRLGFNYRMGEMAAALGVAQLARIDEFIQHRALVASWYEEALQSIEGIDAPVASVGSHVSWFSYIVRLSSDLSSPDRPAILAGLRAKGIDCRDYFTPIHLEPFYQERFGTREGTFPITESESKRTIALPFFGQLSRKEFEYVIQALEELVH